MDPVLFACLTCVLGELHLKFVVVLLIASGYKRRHGPCPIL